MLRPRRSLALLAAVLRNAATAAFPQRVRQLGRSLLAESTLTGHWHEREIGYRDVGMIHEEYEEV